MTNAASGPELGMTSMKNTTVKTGGRALTRKELLAKPFASMTADEKEQLSKELDKGLKKSELQPVTAADIARWERARAKAGLPPYRGRGRPKVGQGSERINVTVERGLLKRADAYAKANDVTRAELIARGLTLLLAS